jgi:nucleotide-binding universal stress UspA family protein
VVAPKRHDRRWRVLVATDSTRGSGAALRFAAALASSSGAALIVLTVAATRGSEAEAESLRRAKSCLASAGRTLKRAGVVAAFELVEAGPEESIPEAIQRESDRLDADLVVIGSEGRDTLREWVVGGVALRLLYLATRPVTVVRPPRRRPNAAHSRSRSANPKQVAQD